MIVIQHLQHYVCNLVGAMGPDIDDLVVALTRRDDTPTILLVHIDNLFLGLLDLLGFFLRDDHIVHPHGDAGLRCRSKTKLLEIIQHTNRFVLTAEAIAIPDDISKHILVHNYVWKPNLLRPNFTEYNPAHSGFDDLLFLVSVWGRIFPKIGVSQADYIVNLQLAVVVRKQHLLLGSEEAHCLLFFANHLARLGCKVITAQGYILGRGNDRLTA